MNLKTHLGIFLLFPYLDPIFLEFPDHLIAIIFPHIGSNFWGVVKYIVYCLGVYLWVSIEKTHNSFDNIVINNV